MSDAIIQALPVPCLLIGGNGQIISANRGARDLFGQEIVGRHHITLLRQPMLLDAIETALRENLSVETVYPTTEARRDITLKATCARVGASGDVLVTFEDRTAMEEAGQMRRDFVANVSHELRTPLTALLGFIETLRGAARDDAAVRDRFLTIMDKEASRMNRLVGDLLSLSRVEAGERVRPTAQVDLSAIAKSVLSTLAPLAADKGVALSSSGLDSPLTVPADADQLAQVMTNLLENAIKYSGRGADVQLDLQSQSSNPLVRGAAAILTVTDTGEGIDPLHIPRLTERFYRIDSHRSRELGGTGLGLAIVKHIVNRHRGRLQIESQPGKGSKFSVILPVDQAAARSN